MTRRVTDSVRVARLQLQNDREQRDHEKSVALINAFAHDPELKYFVGVATGAGVAIVSELFTSTLSPGSAAPVETGEFPVPYATKSESARRKHESWNWVVPGGAALAAAFPIVGGIASSPVGSGAIAAWLLGTPEGKTMLDSQGIAWPTTVSGILTLGATGFAGFCAAVLILKSIFGEKGAGGILGALGSAAAVP